VESHTARATRGVRYEGAWRRLQRESRRPDSHRKSTLKARHLRLQLDRTLPLPCQGSDDDRAREFAGRPRETIP
jgi:hypothetical protein